MKKPVIIWASLVFVVAMGAGYWVVTQGGMSRAFFAVTSGDSSLCRQHLDDFKVLALEQYKAEAVYCSPDFDEGFFGDPNTLKVFGVLDHDAINGFARAVSAMLPLSGAGMTLEFYKQENLWVQWKVKNQEGGFSTRYWRGPEALVARYAFPYTAVEFYPEER